MYTSSNFSVFRCSLLKSVVDIKLLKEPANICLRLHDLVQCTVYTVFSKVDAVYILEVNRTVFFFVCIKRVNW